VRFARLIDRPVRVLGVPSARAASGGNLSLAWLLLNVMRYASRRWWFPPAAGDPPSPWHRLG
jgi:hypothetical protein